MAIIERRLVLTRPLVTGLGDVDLECDPRTMKDVSRLNPLVTGPLSHSLSYTRRKFCSGGAIETHECLLC